MVAEQAAQVVEEVVSVSALVASAELEPAWELERALETAWVGLGLEPVVWVSLSLRLAILAVLKKESVVSAALGTGLVASGVQE